MAKELMKKASAAAVENVLHSAMPQLIQRLDAIQGDLRHLDMKVEQLRQDMYEKFEQTRDVINELGQRIARVEGKLEASVDSVNYQSQKMDKWIERLVKIEMTQGSRRRRAG
ncbi:MAG TPA: hypothetical protein VHD56_03665 [Tepidisphaeraceae bacterium]|nr:hypothetical protein [Tepidisphaeraceae bacterium]